MEQNPERVTRPSVPELDEVLGHPFKVLDDGFVRVVDYMGSDSSIVQAARVSYGTGTKRVHEDRGLIRYLLRHWHTTPFEMADIKFHVRVPMDCWRQWIRHRTACLAEGTEVYFDLPGGVERRGNQLYKLKIEEVWDRFQPTRNATRPDKQRNPYFRRDRVRRMRLRQVDEDTGRIQHTRVVDVYDNGPKPVFRMTLADGKTIECTSDHKFFFDDGWHTVKEGTGLEEQGGRAVWNEGERYLYVNGAMVEEEYEPYRNADWLHDQYNVQERKIADIAETAGVSYHTIRKWIRAHGLQHAKGGRSKKPWNAGREYRLGPRKLSPAWREANLRSRSGEASNFWRGGVSSDRAGIGRWTTQVAAQVHRENGWTCQLCRERGDELHAHHIVPVWADVSLARERSNLTTLCGPCHRQIAGRELDYVERLGGPVVRAEWRKRPRRTRKVKVAKLVSISGFEYVGIKRTFDLEVEGPHHNFVANGIVTHNSVNEYSTRYSIAIDAAQTTAVGEWREQAAGNRQGSEGFVDDAVGARMTEREAHLQSLSREIYEERIEAGVAREQARKDLPLSTYTESYWKTNLHNLLHFLRLRMDDHAQLEIREYARVIGEEIVARWTPIAWQAFLDYRFHSTGLTRLEHEVLRAATAGDVRRGTELAESFGWLDRKDDGTLKRNRERAEAEEKLADLGVAIPWKE